MEPARVTSYAGHLAFEREAQTEHEYVAGQIVAMAGGTPEHARLAMVLGHQLMGHFDGTGWPDLQQRRPGPDRDDRQRPVSRPDDRLRRGRPRRRRRRRDREPARLVEVLSPGTERVDRGEKFAHSKRLESLQEYVLVSQDRARVEVLRRTPEGWLHNEAGPGEVLGLRSIEAPIDVDALYRVA